MNKISTRVILLIVIIVLVVAILLYVRSPFGKNNSSFSAGADKEITRIEFSQNKQRINLEQKGALWQINGKDEARKSGVVFIIRVLQELKIKSPVSPDVFSREIIAKGIIPVGVKVYSDRKMLSSFLVYRTNSNIYGNIMKIRERSKPFIVYVPGFDGEIGSAFITNELYWKPLTIFNLLPSEIASVQYENLTDSSASFKIINHNHYCFLSDDSANTSRWDPSLVSRYLSYFARVPLESWDFDSTEAKKSISEPSYRISVTTTTGRSLILTLWALRADSTGKIDLDRVLGKTNEQTQFFTMKYFDIDPLIKKKAYFYQH